jgi:hypothetical protein
MRYNGCFLDNPILTREKGKALIRRHQSDSPVINLSNQHAWNNRSNTPRQACIYSIASYIYSEYIKLSPKVKNVP